MMQKVFESSRRPTSRPYSAASGTRRLSRRHAAKGRPRRVAINVAPVDKRLVLRSSAGSPFNSPGCRTLPATGGLPSSSTRSVSRTGRKGRSGYDLSHTSESHSMFGAITAEVAVGQYVLHIGGPRGARVCKRHYEPYPRASPLNSCTPRPAIDARAVQPAGGGSRRSSRR